MCILMDKRLAVILNSFLLLKILGLKMQKSTFKKKCFEGSFYKIDVQVVTNWYVGLEKNTKQLKFCLW